MKVLAIGNVFESKSILADEFCGIDSEIEANSVLSRISGAAIVVSTVAAYLRMHPSLYFKAPVNKKDDEFFRRLTQIGIDTSIAKYGKFESNILLTIYNRKLERKCYSYAPDQILADDLLKIDYSVYDAVFFCCIPFEQILPVYKYNLSIISTLSVLLPSGLATPYFANHALRIKPDYIFLNRGELRKIFTDIQGDDKDCLDKYMNLVDIGDSSLIVTMGADGVIIKSKDKIERKTVESIDKIVHPGGAGDSFAVGFIKGVLENSGNDVCCELGHACSKMALMTKNVDELITRFF